LGFYDFSVTTLAGPDLALSTLRGQVVLVVNTASACGFTPQLAGLEALWLARRDQGLVVLGFPCNQFGAQEPGSAPEIQSFCTRRYGVSFPLMAKVDVNGPQAEPLFVWLKAQAPGLLGTQAIKWNFTKFLIGRDGQVLERYAPPTRPEQLQPAIDRALL
jgi:glutathione peroxidase